MSIDQGEKGEADNFEGLYCPASKDISGRLQYLERGGRGRTLAFDPASGHRWCIGKACVASSAVELFGLTSASFDVGAVTDFDGNFEGQDVAGPGGEGGDVAALIKSIPKPKRPANLPVPKLEVLILCSRATTHAASIAGREGIRVFE